jgi:hypothetical protein
MSDTPDHSGVPDDDLLAAEFVLGVLAGTERAAAQRLFERDRNFAALVAQWEQRLAPWAGEIAEVAPPPAIWDRIAAALPAEQPRSAGWWHSLAFWRGLSLATGALAAACIGALVYLGNAPQPAPEQRPMVAAIEGGGHRAFVAAIDRQARHHRGAAGVLYCRRHARAGTLADPGRWQTAPARYVARRPRGEHHDTARIGRANRRQRHFGGVAGAAGRLADRTTDRTGDRHRQAHESVTAFLDRFFASIGHAPP